MSWTPSEDPLPGDVRACDAIEQVIVPRARDLGGFSVRRALPAAGRQMVGPFIFFDQMGPAEFLIGTGIDVRPHPHIGLATVTYLFDGEVMHRDSLGSAVAIKPGELNLMSAGAGIVHSERTSAEQRAKGPRLFGIQAWAALPKSHEEGAPAFAHYDAAQLPRIASEGKTVRVVMGDLYGQSSPAAFPHPSFYAEAVLAPGAVLPLDADYDERAIYVVSGESTSPARHSRLGGCSSSGPATASRCWQPRRRASSCSAASRWMDRGTSGGTSCRPRRTASTPPRPTGRPSASALCRATARSSSRFPKTGRLKCKALRRGAGALNSTAFECARGSAHLLLGFVLRFLEPAARLIDDGVHRRARISTGDRLDQPLERRSDRR
jgi:redox-sensitive bicupin YhaK (pirin superfamily)